MKVVQRLWLNNAKNKLWTPKSIDVFPKVPLFSAKVLLQQMLLMYKLICIQTQDLSKILTLLRVPSANFHLNTQYIFRDLCKFKIFKILLINGHNITQSIKSRSTKYLEISEKKVLSFRCQIIPSKSFLIRARRQSRISTILKPQI